MNHDEKFKKLWEFRRRDDDGDSSDDSKSNPIGESADKKPKLDIVLLENDDDIGNDVETVEPVPKKRKPSKKKVVKNKSKSCSVNEKKGKSKELDTKEAGMFECLKIFANSLINELKVARENMFAEMKEETRKFVNSGSRPRKKKVLHSNKKNKTPPPLQNGIESNLKSQKYPGGLTEKHMKSDKIFKYDQVLEFPTTYKQPSSQYLTLPTVVPKPQSQNHKSDGPHIKLIDPRNNYQGVPAFQSELFRSFSHIGSKNGGFLDRNCSEMTSGSVGFLVPINRELDSSPYNGSNLSSQTYSENAFQDNCRFGLGMMNATFNGASSGGISLDCVSNDVVQTNGGESVPFRSQEMKGQFYPSLRNKQ